jgi:hypothetical protein
MTVVAHSEVQSEDALQSTIKASVGSDCFFVGHNERQLGDLQVGPPSLQALRDYDQGRAFSKACELRWHRTGKSSWSLTLLTETTPAPEFTAVKTTWQTRPIRIRFLGEKVPGQQFWRDTRHTKIFRYPGDLGKRVFLNAVEYIDEQTRRVQYVRWCGLGEGTKNA